MKLNEWNIYLHAALLTTIQLAVAFFLYAGVYTFFDHQTLLFVGTVCTAYLVGALLFSFNFDKIKAKKPLTYGAIRLTNSRRDSNRRKSAKIRLTLRITDPTELCIALFVIENLTTPYGIVPTVMRVRVHPFVLRQ